MVPRPKHIARSGSAGWFSAADFELEWPQIQVATRQGNGRGPRTLLGGEDLVDTDAPFSNSSAQAAMYSRRMR
jgi:hypothetical protein